MAQPAKALPNLAHDNGRSTETVTKPHHLLVIGATRGTGKQLVQQALAAGHTVTALARDPARVEIQDERLAVIRGDVLDPATLAQAMAGCDAVVSSLGVTSAYRKPTTLYSAGMRHIIEAMRANGMTRLIAVTAAPLGDGEGDTLPSRLLGKMLWAFIKEVYADMTRMEEIIRGSGLDWTIIRPPRLTNKPLTGRYRTAVNRNVRGGYSIARADLADACLKLLDDPAAARATIGIGY
jgi:putative NADH-flavin reductase